MVKKIYFPREVLPVSYVTSQFVNMLLSFVVIFIVVICSGVHIRPNALCYLPFVMLAEFILALGITFLVSACNVYFRDLEYILGIISMAWMYLTPILYPMDMVPQQYADIFYMNPMTSITIAYRDILYYGRAPQMNTLLQALLLGMAILVVGQMTFGKLQKKFAEEL